MPSIKFKNNHAYQISQTKITPHTTKQKMELYSAALRLCEKPFRDSASLRETFFAPLRDVTLSAL